MSSSPVTVKQKQPCAHLVEHIKQTFGETNTESPTKAAKRVSLHLASSSLDEGGSQHVSASAATASAAQATHAQSQSQRPNMERQPSVLLIQHIKDTFGETNTQSPKKSSFGNRSISSLFAGEGIQNNHMLDLDHDSDEDNDRDAKFREENGRSLASMLFEPIEIDSISSNNNDHNDNDCSFHDDGLFVSDLENANLDIEHGDFATTLSNDAFYNEPQATAKPKAPRKPSLKMSPNVSTLPEQPPLSPRRGKMKASRQQGGTSRKISRSRRDVVNQSVRGSTTSTKRGQLHFGDRNFVLDTTIANKTVSANLLHNLDDPYDDVTWHEIGHTCCFHSSREWLVIALGIVAFFVLLYIFFFGLTLMRNASKVMSGCATGALFGSEANAFTLVMIGILTTVLLQSSSAVVAVIVTLEEAGALTVEQGIYMVMGANVGTTITSTLVTLGQLRNENELELGVAAASTHTLFNFLTVLVLFPLECSFGYLQAATSVLVETAETGGREDTYVGPIKGLIQPLVDVIINGNTKLITGVAKGKSCRADFYPIDCDPDLEPSYKTCTTGLIGCNKETGTCPWLFRETASIHQDRVMGGLMFLLAMVILVLSTMALIAIIKLLLDGLSVRIVHASTRCNGYFGILFGGAVTVFVQSSQVVVSTLVPFAGVGALPLETVYPIVVGSNIGTALQTVMTSLGAFGAAPLQVALAHLFFNITGGLLWYPLPHLRALVLWLARRMGEAARVWRFFPIVSMLLLYLIVPLFVFGLSKIYFTGHVVAEAFVVLVGIGCGLGALYLLYWCKVRGGYRKYVAHVANARSKQGPNHQSSESILTATNDSSDASLPVTQKRRTKDSKRNVLPSIPATAKQGTTMPSPPPPPLPTSSANSAQTARRQEQKILQTRNDMNGSEHYV